MNETWKDVADWLRLHGWGDKADVLMDAELQYRCVSTMSLWDRERNAKIWYGDCNLADGHDGPHRLGRVTWTTP